MKEREKTLYEAHFALEGESVHYRLFSTSDRLWLSATHGEVSECFDLGASREEAVAFARAIGESETAPCMISELFEEAFP